MVEHYFTHLQTSEENKKSARWHFKEFCDHQPKDSAKPVGKMRVQNVKPYMLTEYLATKPHWKPNTVRYAITRILAALNYCEREGYITANPLKGYKRPTVERRENIVTDEELDKLIAASMPEFRDLLICMRELGTRPKELFTATIERFDEAKGILMVGNKLARVTGEKQRPVFLTQKATEIIKGRIGNRTEGAIFLNKRGNPWDRHTGQQYVKRLRTRLGLGNHISLYGLRHLFISHAINENNSNAALLAVQAGWTDLRRLMKTYLHTDTEAMRRAVEQAAKRDPKGENRGEQ